MVRCSSDMPLSDASAKAMDQSEKSMQLTIDAPNLLQKNKFIDNTSLLLAIDGEEHVSQIYNQDLCH